MLSSSRKHACIEDKFNYAVINKLKSVICVETFNLIGSQSMMIMKQQDSSHDRYHRKDEMMGQVEKFMKGMDVYSNIWQVEATSFGNCHIIPYSLHCQPNKVLVQGDQVME